MLYLKVLAMRSLDFKKYNSFCVHEPKYDTKFNSTPQKSDEINANGQSGVTCYSVMRQAILMRKADDDI